MAKSLYTQVFGLVLLIFLSSCIIGKGHSKELLKNSLNNSVWVIENENSRDQRDTIMFSFGFTNTNEELNLILINSNSHKEQSEFSFTKRKIKFGSEIGLHIFSDVTNKYTKKEVVLYYKNNLLRIKSRRGISRKINISRL